MELKNFSALNYNTSLTSAQIDVFRKRLIANIADLNLTKGKFRTEEFNQLMNYHQYSLNILNNMLNIKAVEQTSPYARGIMGPHETVQPTILTNNPYEQNLKVVYQPDGRTKIVNMDELSKSFKQSWELQFDEQIHNPPSYIIPPSNCWGLPDRKDRSDPAKCATAGRK
jgi:hypothetical protein